MNVTQRIVAILLAVIVGVAAITATDWSDFLGNLVFASVPVIAATLVYVAFFKR